MKAEYVTTKAFTGVTSFEYPGAPIVDIAEGTSLELTDFNEYSMTFKTDDNKVFSLHRQNKSKDPCDYTKYSALPEGIRSLT